jgi:hypothetical protein
LATFGQNPVFATLEWRADAVLWEGAASITAVLPRSRRGSSDNIWHQVSETFKSFTLHIVVERLTLTSVWMLTTALCWFPYGDHSAVSALRYAISASVSDVQIT